MGKRPGKALKPLRAVMERGEQDEKDKMVGDYAEGGRRDPRIIAVTATARIEEAVAVIEEQLREVKYGGLMKPIGRLRLTYDQRAGRFRWRRRVGPREWEDVGARVPDETRRKMRVGARAKVERADEWLDIRAAGLTVLRLLRWCAAKGAGWAETTVTVRWRGGVRPTGIEGRVMWGCMLSGGRIRRGGILTEDGPPERYARDVEQLLNGRGNYSGRGPGGQVTWHIEQLVQQFRDVNHRLEIIAQELRGVGRLYYNPTRDSWQVQEVIGVGRSRYLGHVLTDELLRRVSAADRGRLVEAEELLGWRGRVKRALHVIGVVAAAGSRWPGGTWQVRGERGGGTRAAWVMNATEYGLLFKSYEGGEKNRENVCGRNNAISTAEPIRYEAE